MFALCWLSEDWREQPNAVMCYVTPVAGRNKHVEFVGFLFQKATDHLEIESKVICTNPIFSRNFEKLYPQLSEQKASARDEAWLQKHSAVSK